MSSNKQKCTNYKECCIQAHLSEWYIKRLALMNQPIHNDNNNNNNNNNNNIQLNEIIHSWI